MDISFYAFSMFLKIITVFAIFYLIVAFGTPLEKSRIKCPRGTEAIMDNDLSERPCYNIIHQKMSYFEASRACKSWNGFIPGINNNFKDISITSSALILKQLYNEHYFWLGCQNLTGKFICDDGTELGNYDNWDNTSDISHTSARSCVVVSLTSGKWKMADCLGRFAFPCKYPAEFDTSTTPEINETDLTLPPPGPINVILDLKNLPDFTALFLWIFVILILIFGCLQCLFYQFIQCMKNMKISQPRRSSNNNNNNNNPCQERMRRRTISNQSHGRINSFGSYFSNSASGQYSPDPSEEAARLLESQEEIRTRSFSTFSNRNWIPATTINAQIQQNNNSPPQSVIITIPPQSSQIPQTMNTEEFVSLHGNYSNYPSLPRSEISSILEQLSAGNYIPRENRPWDLPPQYPIYYRTEGNEEIGVSLCRNMPQLLPPPPYSDFNVAQPSLPTMPMPTVNLHNNRLPHNTPVVPPPPLNLPSQRVNDSLSSARILGVPVLPPAFENGIFANQVRRSQNRRNRFNEENERLFKKRV